MKFLNPFRKKTIGLALGSGAARGIAHIGVLKALQEKNIKLDYISGCSMGALIGGAYAAGMSVKQLEDIATQNDWKLMAKMFFPSFSRSSLVKSKFLEEFILSIFGDKNFNDLKIPFSAVATDINTGEPVILDSGDLKSAIRASVSIPVMFVPASVNGRRLADGALVNPVPVDILRNKKIDKIIAVSITGTSPVIAPSEQIKHPVLLDPRVASLSINEKIQELLKKPSEILGKKSEEKEPDPTMWNVMAQSFFIVQDQISRLNMQVAKPDILITPDTRDFSLLDFTKVKELIEIGYISAMQKLAEGR